MKKLYTSYISKLSCLTFLACLLFSCSHRVEITKQLATTPHIFPDYQEVTIPQNIAPLHFRVEKEVGEVVAAKFSTDGGKVVEVEADGNDICMDAKDWRDLLKDANEVSVQVHRGEKWGGVCLQTFPYRSVERPYRLLSRLSPHRAWL